MGDIEIPAGHELVNGRLMMVGPKGELVPPVAVKEKYKLEDQLVRKLIAAGQVLSALLSEFKASSFEEVDTFAQLLTENYQAKPGGSKGNWTLQSYDGLLKVTVQTQGRFKFGNEIQVAKALIDECLMEWSANAPAQLQAIVTDAFRVDNENNYNRGAILNLRRFDFDDERWKRAMQAIADSEQEVGSARYLRLHTRAANDGPWVVVPLDLATA